MTGPLPEINESEIVAYYDNCEVDYSIVWHLRSQMCMHYGFWDSNTPNLRSALNNMNAKLAEYAGIKPGDLVLDAGCGVGGSSVYLAKNFGCRTIGITLSQKQVESCRLNASDHGVSELARFERQNYLDTSFPDNYFDVVWAIESVCYAYDKKDFLKEAFRILKPGGRIVVADFFSVFLEPGSKDFNLMDKWTDTWAIKSYAETEVFNKKMDAVGFANRVTRDVTKNVVPSIRRLYWSFWPGIVITNISQFMGYRNSIQTANTWSTYYQYKAYKRGLWKYNLISGIKP